MSMNMPSEPAENKVVFEKFLASTSGAVVRPWLAREIGLEAAVLLNQLVYWSHHKADDKGWFGRSKLELRNETGLTDWGFRSAIKKLVVLGYIAEAAKWGKGNTSHYRLNIDRVNECLLQHKDSQVGWLSTNLQVGCSPTNQSSQVGCCPTNQSSQVGCCPTNPPKKNTDPEEHGVPEEHDRAFAAAAGGDRLVVLGELGEVGQECPSPEKQPDQQPAPIPSENSQTAQTSRPPPPRQPTSPGDDLDYGQYSINQIESPEIKALLAAAVSSQAKAVRQARV